MDAQKKEKTHSCHVRTDMPDNYWQLTGRERAAGERQTRKVAT